MSTSRFRPVTQVPMTNVAVVRYKKYGKRFEIAAYRNKVVNWRNGVEKDIDEVLQSDFVFESVSKGISAKAKDLEKVFGSTDHSKCARVILDEGDLQISDRERQAHLDNLFRDIASIIASKCVEPTSNRPYPVSVIERAMKDVHFGAKLNKNAKQQALELIPRLKEVMAIRRSQMRVRFCVPSKVKDDVLDLLRRDDAEIEHENDNKASIFFQLKIDPGTYRKLQECVDKYGAENCALEVLELSIQQDASTGDTHRYVSGQDPEQLREGSSQSNPRHGDSSGGAVGEETKTAAGASSKVVQPTSVGKCNTCGINFENKEQQKAHYRDQWHRFNLKRKMKGVSPIEDAEFRSLTKEELTKEMEKLSV
eukprot:gb/GECG01002440.1/.p1 GENE.gb/GECG01002440.1/~~gb/GECG01002440.1/.p1  ORF type:complete len:366 (+),score=54.86 gb/GECG01002440.1/:1-1098(+)